MEEGRIWELPGAAEAPYHAQQHQQPYELSPFMTTRTHTHTQTHLGLAAM